MKTMRAARAAFTVKVEIPVGQQGVQPRFNILRDKCHRRESPGQVATLKVLPLTISSSVNSILNQRSRRTSSHPLRSSTLEIRKPAVFPVEEQLDGADRPVAVLGNHDLCDVLLLGLRVVVVLAVDEEDEIGDLLKLPRIMDNKPICDKVVRTRHNEIVNRVTPTRDNFNDQVP